ncbi:MAG TPA: DUF1003 domain-containing protein [Bryobacteraceae bacterium]|nr:DUF1003 domain-containing protein [Bryobacteraceae bacterium]
MSSRNKPLAGSEATSINSSQERTRTDPGAADIAERNIRTVAQLQAGFRRERTWAEKIADRIASFVGSMAFALLHLTWFCIWILWNLDLIPGFHPFDPFPFMLLSLIVSCEAVVLSTFVLIKQNRMGQNADERAHLNLQIDILAEQEITKMLQTLRLICRRLHIREVDSDVLGEALSRETGVESLAKKVHEEMPKE